MNESSGYTPWDSGFKCDTKQISHRHNFQVTTPSRSSNDSSSQDRRSTNLASEDAEASVADDPFRYAPISQLIGLEVQSGEPGEAEIYLNVDQRMHNPMGFVHGGVLSLLADAVMGIAFGRTLDDQHGFATVEMKVSYLRPVKETRLYAKATLIQRGLRIGFLECTIVDSRKKLIATGSCTCSVNSL